MRSIVSMEVWLPWLAATAVAAVTLTVGAYATFQTKDSATQSSGSMEKRLDRMENKIDILIERRVK